MGFYEKITEMQGTLERVVRAIPGFAGYLHKEDRRAADALLRERITRIYDESLHTLSRLTNRLAEKEGMTYMEQVQRIDTALVTFIDRVKAAPRGYAGAFDPVKVDVDRLAQIYAFDEALLTYQDQLSSGLVALENAIGSEGVEIVLDQLEMLVAELNSVLTRRSEVMLLLQN